MRESRSELSRGRATIVPFYAGEDAEGFARVCAKTAGKLAACEQAAGRQARGDTTKPREMRAAARCRLFPLDGAGGLAGQVVDDAVDAGDFVDEPAGDGFEVRKRKLAGLGGHGVDRGHGADAQG